jgi:hypothetical protein
VSAFTLSLAMVASPMGQGELCTSIIHTNLFTVNI